MKKLTIELMLVVTVIFFMAASAFAQAPDTVWSRTYKANSAALSLHEMPDSGFILGGYITPEGDAYRDMFLVRTNSEGDTLWTSTIGQSAHHESASCLYPTADGGFILTGNRAEDAPYTSYSDIYLVKTNQLGEFEWHAIFGSDLESETGVSVVPTVDSGYLVAGYFWDASTVYDIWLLKTNYLGILEWPDHITWADADYPTCINLTADSGFAITGCTQSFDAEYDYDMFILRLDQTGVEAWAFPYGSSYPYDEAANHICHTSDGGFLICGYRKDDSSSKDIYVVKTDRFGVVDWTSQLGGTYHDEARCCIETVDGGYAVSASWYRDGNWQTGLIKYNAVGDTMWTAFWGDPANSCTPYGLVQTADNGYAVGGLMSGDTSSAFLVKFASDPGIGLFTFRSANLNIPIGDISPAADTITIDLAGHSIVGVKVMVDTLDHPAVDELTITLAHDGTEVTLVAEGDATGTDFTGTVLSDASITFFSGGLAPYNGTYRPNERLSAFNGLDPNGDWILRVSDGTSGNDGVLKAWGITLLTDIVLDADDRENDRLLPDYNLSQCYPNPFNPVTTMSYSVPRRSKVTIEIFNILGQKVQTLTDETKPAGEYQIIWNGDDSNGLKVSAGIYFYRFQAGDFVETKKMLLLK